MEIKNEALLHLEKAHSGQKDVLSFFYNFMKLYGAFIKNQRKDRAGKDFLQRMCYTDMDYKLVESAVGI